LVEQFGVALFVVGRGGGIKSGKGAKEESESKQGTEFHISNRVG
jgi:hypothetical protein